MDRILILTLLLIFPRTFSFSQCPTFVFVFNIWSSVSFLRILIRAFLMIPPCHALPLFYMIGLVFYVEGFLISLFIVAVLIYFRMNLVQKVWGSEYLDKYLKCWLSAWLAKYSGISLETPIPRSACSFYKEAMFIHGCRANICSNPLLLDIYIGIEVYSTAVQ